MTDDNCSVTKPRLPDKLPARLVITDNDSVRLLKEEVNELTTSRTAVILNTEESDPVSPPTTLVREPVTPPIAPVTPEIDPLIPPTILVTPLRRPVTLERLLPKLLKLLKPAVSDEATAPAEALADAPAAALALP